MLEQGRRVTSRKPERGDLVIHVTKKREDTWKKYMKWLDQCAVGWEQKATRPTGPDPVTTSSSDSLTHRTPIEDDEQEIPKERTASETRENTYHGPREAIINIESIQQGRTCLESSEIK